MNKTIIIGLDGMPYGLIRNVAKNGTMPNLNKIMDQGVLRQMASSIPEISSVAWSSIITGKNPAEHGTFGFTDFASNTYRMTFPNYATLKEPAFWEKKNMGRSVIINVPSTYPAREFNGVLISGFVALNLQKAVYPASLLSTLEDFNYQVDVDYSRASESIDYFLRDLERTLDARIETYRYLWENESWENFVLVFTGVDRLAHYLWHAYEDPDDPYHQVFLDHLSKIDETIGEIGARMDDNDNVVLLSDHGFERLEKEVFINHLLLEKGYLRFNGAEKQRFNDIAPDTKAFALDPGRIYIHYEDKYPRGSVKPEDGKIIIDELSSILEDLEIDGKRVIQKLYHKEEIFSGPYIDQAPDLVPLAAAGFNLRPTLNTSKLWDHDQRSGKHSQKDAFLLVKADGAEDVVPENPTVFDVVPILEQLKGNIC